TRFVTAPGIPIGWPGAGSDGVVSFTLERLETLVLYTDGLVEATKDILDGLESLAETATEACAYPARPLARALAERALAGAPGALSLRAWGEDDAIVVEVSDDGGGFEWGGDDDPPDPDVDEGRGLFLVSTLADQLDVERDGERTVVRAVKRAVLPSERGAE